MRDHEINEREDKLLEAMKGGDIQTLNLLLHNNLLFHIPSGEIVTKALDIEYYHSGKMKVNDIRVRDRVISTVDDVSVVSSTIELYAKYMDHAIDGMFKYLRVWRLNGEVWQVIAGSAIQIK